METSVDLGCAGGGSLLLSSLRTAGEGSRLDLRAAGCFLQFVSRYASGSLCGRQAEEYFERRYEVFVARIVARSLESSERKRQKCVAANIVANPLKLLRLPLLLPEHALTNIDMQLPVKVEPVAVRAKVIHDPLHAASVVARSQSGSDALERARVRGKELRRAAGRRLHR